MNESIDECFDKENPFWNGFLLQVFVSSIPHVIVMSAIPMVATMMNGGIVSVGILFFLLRIGIIVGGFIGAITMRWRPPHILCAGFEFLNVIVCGGLLIAVVVGNIFLFGVFTFLTGVLTGAIGNARPTWLRQFRDVRKANLILLTSGIIGQSGYAISGLLLLLFHEFGYHFSIVAIAVDIVSSLVGIFIFLKMKQLHFPVIKSQKSEGRNFNCLINTPLRKSTFILDVMVSFAIGGSLTFIAQSGSLFSSSGNGYGLALLIYASTTMLSGFILRGATASNLPRKILVDWSVVLVFMGLLLFTVGGYLGNKILIGIGLFSFFLTSAAFFQTMQMFWFRIVKSDEAAKVFAARTAIIAIISASAEAFFPLLGSLGTSFRIAILFISVGTLFYIRGKNSLSFVAQIDKVDS